MEDRGQGLGARFEAWPLSCVAHLSSGPIPKHSGRKTDCPDASGTQAF
jgi:hypothetical protein